MKDMNWYKYAQLYDEVDEWYPDDDALTIYDEKYFAIGQNEETHEQSFCWAFINGRVVARRGRTHGSNFGHEITDKTYKGWYDPVQNLLSVAVPRRNPWEINIKYTEDDIPDHIKRALRNKFGDNFRMVVF